MPLIWIYKILHTWNLLSINWASLETGQFSRNAMTVNLLYSCYIYMHVQTILLYQNKLYIFPIVGLAFFYIGTRLLYESYNQRVIYCLDGLNLNTSHLLD